jgi:hypothetical protein
MTPPILSVYDESTGLVYLTQEVKPSRYNLFSWYVPKRNQYILYLYDKDASVTDTSTDIAFTAIYNNITYDGTDTNQDTYFTDLLFEVGMIFNITGSLSNNLTVSILAIIDGTAIGTTEHITEGDFGAAGANWTFGNDWALNVNVAEWTYSATRDSMLTQAKADLASPLLPDIYYRLEYDVNVTLAPDGDFEMYLSASEVAAIKTALPLTAGTHIVEFYSAPNADLSDFIIYASAPANTTQGQFDIDNITLKTAGTGQVMKVEKLLTTEAAGNSVTLSQDPGGICFVYDILGKRFVKFENMNILRVAVMAGGDQLHNLNLHLTNNGTINMYPDDDSGVYTTDETRVQKTLDFYQIDLRRIAINHETAVDARVDVSIDDELNDKLTSKSKTVTSTDNNLVPIRLPRGFHGNKVTLTMYDFDVIKYYILNVYKRKVRRT